MILAAFPNDPISAYLAKGEIKENYFNPGGMFDQVHLITLAKEDARPDRVRSLAGRAELFIHPVGRPGPLTLPFFFDPVGDLVKAIAPDLIRAHNPWVGRGPGRLRRPEAGDSGPDLPPHRERPAPPLRQEPEIPVGQAPGALLAEKGRDRGLRLRLPEGLRPPPRGPGKRPRSTTRSTRPSSPGRRPGVSTTRSGSSGWAGWTPRRPRISSIKALAGLGPERRAELTLIGQGSLRPSLERLVSDLGLSGRVRFVGSVDHARIQEHYHRADILALATHYEGFCIPILEAMAAGLPVLASDTPPLDEIIGGAGLIVDKTPEAFAQALGGWIDDPRPALALGRAAAVRARELDGEVMEAREVALYGEILNRTRGGGS